MGRRLRIVLIVISKLAGAILILLAFLQWITFDYPDVNPFWPGAIFVPGMLSQVLNWGIVVVLGAAGWTLFTIGRLRSSQKDKDNS